MTAAMVSAAQAGHEVNYYPSFYPQEIRIEPLDPEQAAKEFVSTTDPLHAYLGRMPTFAQKPPIALKAVESLGSIFTVRINPASVRLQGRAERCTAMAAAAAAFIAAPDFVAHPYPVTPYHADYLGHVDRVAVTARGATALAVRAGDEARLATKTPIGATWDLALDEVPLSAILTKAAIGLNAWPAPPWSKEGWFQAYHLLRADVGEAIDRERADALYGRLTNGEYRDQAEQIGLERELIEVLTHGCERAVVGYRVRREIYNDDFSNGIENILIDSQVGLNSPVFVRTVKLKDFPWNGWLRLGIDTKPVAAWNPVAGFTDAAGRLVWSAIGDNAFLPIPYNSRWAQNRVEVRPDEGPKAKQSFRIPVDALAPDISAGRLVPVGPNAAATDKVTYRVLASAFHDGAEMEAADLLYPYALAFRWGEQRADAKTFDLEIAAATQVMRERFKGARVIRVEESKLTLADLTFTYHSPIVEVYLDNPPSDEPTRAVIAPPWSSAPWHVLALIEAAVERGIAAFSQSEAARRGIPWLDLVRDRSQLEKLRALIREFAHTSYRPSALEGLVTSEVAKARWEALDAFAAEKGHLLVTNGPYRLRSWSPEATTLDVVREFTYPVGLGTFNPYTYPPRAIITTVTRVGDTIAIAADVEMAVKAQRDHMIVRTALKRDTLRDTYPINADARYVLVGADGRVAAAGAASRQMDGRFVAQLPAGLPAGQYTASAAVFLDGNTFAADIGRVTFRKD